jgi:SAM-dependent methyltransferase
VFVHPPPTAAQVRAHYNEGRSSRLEYYVEANSADRRTFDVILARVRWLLPTRGRLLDVGPNVGTGLTVASEQGWSARGLEINEAAARYCREQRGLDVMAGTLEDANLPADSIDLVLMCDVIEHLLDPLASMRRVHAVLRPGGVALVSTPDISRLATRVLQIKPDEHLFYFTAVTLGVLLGAAGFRVEAIEPFDRYRNLMAMGQSTTLRGPLAVLRPLVRCGRRVLGDVVVRLPLRENLLAVAVKV